ncbi:biopolymer transporter ExbD [Paludibacter sp. 221]|uniref:ExbD/TolR family protein n=1 Tax=Paludibacter sp. 221 TaxID=2302939 RepID=UPI0013D4B9C8|nr:biopolymer transporter ExbD [Paludibacter sp. 221]NDV45444.1 biopolymer transporter ExbD [Paludibacter sp. 221]
MAKIRKDQQRETPEMSTSSLPDIIFMFLFFFMMITTMKEVTYKVQISPVQATELTKLENKSLVRYVYIGKPTQEWQKTFGTETRIQLGDAFADVAQLEDYIVTERSSMKEEDQNLMTVSIKADKDTRMGVVTDVKQALRRAYALRINYSAVQKTNR